MTSINQMLQRATIIRTDIGSRGFGLDHPASDHDHKAVAVEDFSLHVTTGAKWEQHGPHQFSPGEIEAYPEGLDLETYSLWKFNKLAMQGNPNILCILFGQPIHITEAGKALQALAPSLVSKQAGKAFLGYMQAQKTRLTDRGRPRYVEKYGFDVKFAMHLLRIGFQGIELLKSGKLTLPLPQEVRDILIPVREGKVPVKECLKMAETLEADLKSAMVTSKLREQPDRDYVEIWTRSLYWNEWLKRSPNEIILKPKDLGFGDVTIH